MGAFDKNPGLALEWSDLNDIDPETLTPGSNYKACWVCAKGHRWSATVNNRSRGSGCPYCTNKKVLEGYNDLATTHPEVAKEWSDRNTLKPTEVVAGSNRAVWWLGDCGHEWEQPVGKRTSRGDGCVYCAKAGTTLLPGFNDLESRFPEISKEWHPRNTKRPSEVFSKTQTRFWWLGDCGHEWETTVANRTHNRAGCPFCASNPKVLKGFNDLLTRFPLLAKEWDSEENDVGPGEVTPGSAKKYGWVCSRGHKWRATVGSRTSKKGARCGYCTGRRAIPGETDLATLRPDIVSQWDHSANPGLTPETTTVQSNSRVGWRCEKGHTWVASVHDRTRLDGRHTNCPTCSANIYVSRGEQEVAGFIEEAVGRVETSFRGLKGVHEVDVYCPDLRLAVEYNGLYWHSERVRTKRYHADKTTAVGGLGIQLIHVWEDDWVFRRPVVERMLKRKLGVSDEPRLNARSLTYRQVSSGEASSFLEENHIQGPSGGSWRGGLFKSDELVALMLMKRRSEGKYELTRFATSAIVRGGHSKLLKRFIEEVNPWQIITFADRGVSDGGLYEKSGFVKDGELAPDYMYRVGQKREHKFNYRKARFKKDPNLKYEEGLTEKQLADLNGLDRIYDAGKVRWVWERDK